MPKRSRARNNCRSRLSQRAKANIPEPAYTAPPHLLGRWRTVSLSIPRFKPVAPALQLPAQGKVIVDGACQKTRTQRLVSSVMGGGRPGVAGAQMAEAQGRMVVDVACRRHQARGGPASGSFRQYPRFPGAALPWRQNRRYRSSRFPFCLLVPNNIIYAGKAGLDPGGLFCRVFLQERKRLRLKACLETP